MESIVISWSDFKNGISTHIDQKKGNRMCRGQSNSTWPLVTSFHRRPNGFTLPQYFQIVAKLADDVGTIENRLIDVRDNEVNGSFLAYLQHHGFPTPLLDWTLSPYIAAYFAFADVNDLNPASDYISVYVFDYTEWIGDWKQTYDYSVTDPHVTVLSPKAMGNKRQIIQQAPFYTFTNVTNISDHINMLGKQKNKIYLEKYDISVKERPNAMIELETMGITYFSLFANTEALCRHYKEAVFRSPQVGMTPSERMADFFKRFPKPDKINS